MIVSFLLKKIVILYYCQIAHSFANNIATHASIVLAVPEQSQKCFFFNVMSVFTCVQYSAACARITLPVQRQCYQYQNSHSSVYFMCYECINMCAVQCCLFHNNPTMQCNAMRCNDSATSARIVLPVLEQSYQCSLIAV